MKCFYINLDSATGRRALLEANFAAAAPAGWDLVRVPAVGRDDAGALPGSCTPAAKGCYASHLAALDLALQEAGDVLIVEDDVLFSPRSFELLDRVRAAGVAWDVLHTAPAVRDLKGLLDFASHWRGMTTENRFLLRDAAEVYIASADAYLVRDGSKQRVRDAMAAARIDVPYDLQLQKLSRAGELQVRLCFPFITSSSSAGAVSQINETPPSLLDEAVAAFRRLLFVDADLSDCARETEGILRRAQDRHAQLCGALLGAIFVANPPTLPGAPR